MWHMLLPLVFRCSIFIFNYFWLWQFCFKLLKSIIVYVVVPWTSHVLWCSQTSIRNEWTDTCKSRVNTQKKGAWIPLSYPLLLYLIQLILFWSHICLTYFTATTTATTTLFIYADRKCPTFSRLLWWDSFRGSPCWCVNTPVTWVHAAMGLCYSIMLYVAVANEPDEWDLSCTHNCTISGCFQLSLNFVKFLIL